MISLRSARISTQFTVRRGSTFVRCAADSYPSAKTCLGITGISIHFHQLAMQKVTPRTAAARAVGKGNEVRAARCWLEVDRATRVYNLDGM